MGLAILNADDPHVAAMADCTRAKVITFGVSANADVRATQISSVWPEPLTFNVSNGSDTLTVRTKLIGEHWVTSILAALACGLACGVDLRQCMKAVEEFEAPFGRYSVHSKRGGPSYVFDHKAPFWTIATSLAFIKSARAPRKTMVFGTISDYPGKASPSQSRQRCVGSL